MHVLGAVRSIRQWRLYSREWYKDCWNLGLAAVWRKVTISPAKALDWTWCIPKPPSSVVLYRSRSLGFSNMS